MGDSFLNVENILKESQLGPLTAKQSSMQGQVENICIFLSFCSFADSRSLYCASYDNDKVILFNSTSGISIILNDKSNVKSLKGI